MRLSTLFKGRRYYYLQPDLPWYKRLVGMKYGKGWRIAIEDSTVHVVTAAKDVPPTPALVMQETLRLQDSLGD